MRPMRSVRSMRPMHPMHPMRSMRSMRSMRPMRPIRPMYVGINSAIQVIQQDFSPSSGTWHNTSAFWRLGDEHFLDN